jgi:cell division protein FtsB
VKNLLISAGLVIGMAILFFAFHSRASNAQQRPVSCDLNGLCTEVEQLRDEGEQLKNQVAQLRNEIAQLKNEVAQIKKSEPRFDYAMVSNPTPTIGSNSFVLRDYSKVSPPAQEVEVVFVSTNVGTFVVSRKQPAQFNQSNMGGPYPGSFALTDNKLNFNWTIDGGYGTVVNVLGLTAIYKP